MLRNASQDLAQKVAAGLGMEILLGAMPLALADPAKPEATVSPPLSLMARRRHERDGHTMEFIKDRYRHCKPIMVLGASKALLDKVGVPTTLPDGKADAGLIIVPTGSMAMLLRLSFKQLECTVIRCVKLTRRWCDKAAVRSSG